MTISNIIADKAKGAFATVASPGEAQTDYGAAGSTINYLLINTTGDAIADATKQGYTNESDFNANELATAGGYTVQGMAPGSQVVTVSSHVVKATSAAATWAAATLTAYGVWLVKHTGLASANLALLYYTFGGAVTSTSATFTVTPNASGLFTIT